MKIMIDNKYFEVLDLDQLDNVHDPVATIHLSCGDWHWYVIAAKQSPDQYCYGLVDGFEKEFGFFSLKDLLLCGAEVDMDFKPMKASELIGKRRV